MRRSRRENVACPEVSHAETGASAGPEAKRPETVTDSAAAELRDLSESLSSIPLDWDDWELDEDLRQAERLTHPSPRTSENVAAALLPPSPLISPRAPGRRPERKSRSEKSGLGHSLGWLVLSLGLMPFVCGAVLVGWSFFSGRADLWRIGVPLTLLGQTGWLIGMLLQLDGLWQSHRRTSQTLEELEGRVDELRETAALMSTSHSGDAKSFYAHFADGAGPSLLLADLKGQLDLLAVQLSRQRAA